MSKLLVVAMHVSRKVLKCACDRDTKAVFAAQTALAVPKNSVTSLNSAQFKSTVDFNSLHALSTIDVATVKSLKLVVTGTGYLWTHQGKA